MTDPRSQEPADLWTDRAPDPLWSRPERTLGAYFRRLGIAIEVRANTQRLLELAADAFGPAESAALAEGDPTARSPQPLRLSLIDGPPPGGDGWPAAPTEPLGGHVARARPIFREMDGRFVAFDGAGSCVMADLHAGVAVAWVCAGSAPDRVRTLLVETPLWRLATQRGLLALHGAAVVVDGVAVVVRGAAGAGKSSVALAADVAGSPVLAEEVAWLDAVRWAIWPAARRIHMVDAAALRLAVGAAAQHVGSERTSTALPEGEKVAVRLSTLVPTDAVPIGPLVLLGSVNRLRATGTVTWRALGSAAARTRCEAERIVGEYAQPEARWDGVAMRLCGGAYALEGGSPAERAEALVSIVQHWRQKRSGPADETPDSAPAPWHEGSGASSSWDSDAP